MGNGSALEISLNQCNCVEQLNVQALETKVKSISLNQTSLNFTLAHFNSKVVQFCHKSQGSKTNDDQVQYGKPILTSSRNV